MQSVITDFQGMNVILRDDNGNRQTLDIFYLYEQKDDKSTTTFSGKELQVHTVFKDTA